MSKDKMKSYRAEFKERAVKLALKSDRSVAQSARGLGVNVNTLHRWLSKYYQGGSVTLGSLVLASTLRMSPLTIRNDCQNR